jgi:hypothetical protein
MQVIGPQSPECLGGAATLRPRPAFLNLFTLEEPLKEFSGLREPLHKNYYIYSSRYVSVISTL